MSKTQRIVRTSIAAYAWLLFAMHGGIVAAAEPVETVTLRVMSFNVWYGAEQVSLEKIGEAIRAADPDIVGVQEADRNLWRIAEVAGMPYVDERRRLLSRWQIFDSGSGIRTETGASPYSTTALDQDALLVGEDGSVLKRSAFTVAKSGARPEVEAITAIVKPGEPVQVRWRDTPGDLRDWIGVYRAGETDISSYLGFVYTEAAFAGEASFLPGPGGEPLPPGDYELRLMHDESYVVLAKARFTQLP